MKFHYLVRGIILINEKVLLVHQKGSKNTFLPGGHIESGERAENALLREIEEEIGMKAKIERFVGAVEHTWNENGNDNHEINLIFNVAVSELTTDNPPSSKESHLEFVWSRLPELKDHNLQPYPLLECIQSFYESKVGYWGSSINKSA
jgi:8-oxo-dGTP diphosphatase